MALKNYTINFKNGTYRTVTDNYNDYTRGDKTTTYNKSASKFTVESRYYNGKDSGDNLFNFIKIPENPTVGDILYTFKNGAYCKIVSVGEVTHDLYTYYSTIESDLSVDGTVLKLNALSDPATSYYIKKTPVDIGFFMSDGTDVTKNITGSGYAGITINYCENKPNTLRMVAWGVVRNNKLVTTSMTTIDSDVVNLNKMTTNYYGTLNGTTIICSTPFFSVQIHGITGNPKLIEFAVYSSNAKPSSLGEDTGGESTPGGQNGNFDDSSDNINIPTLPTTTASSCGMVKMYEMSLAQTQALAGYLWSGASEFYENLTKMFIDPMDSIVSLSLAPIKPSVGGSTTIEICKYAIENVTGYPLTSQYASLNCGTIKIEPYWGNALDYAPYTKASIYLPFIGTQELNIDDVMNRTVGVTYNIDLLSGACACMITCDGSIMYNFSGNVISQIPVSGKNALEMYKSVISAVTNTALAVGTGAGGVALAGDVVSNGLSVMGSKMTVQRGGTISATNGVLGVKFPYITILRANQSLPADFHSFKGYPSNISGKVSSFSGYTEVEYVHVTGINATENELEMIEQILKEGFII